MKKYRISKKGWSSNTLAPISTFGDTREFFEGYSETPPTVGERFTLRTKRWNDVVISTSIVVNVGDGLFTTIYSQYYFEEYED